jgi:hypothetical protein
MEKGVVKSMESHQYLTPNAGIVTDLATGNDYNFTRPTITTGHNGEVSRWNVKCYDVVTFTISGTNALNVTLYKKHRRKNVYSVH